MPLLGSLTAAGVRARVMLRGFACVVRPVGGVSVRGMRMVAVAGTSDPRGFAFGDSAVD
jgi:hypothetical protein